MKLSFENLTHVYKSPTGESRKVLDIGHWEIEAGKQALLRGISGSGKTTLFNITAGLLRPSTGKVMYGHQGLYDLTPVVRDRFRARTIGYVFQNHHLLNSLTALENVVMPIAFARKYPRWQWRKKAQDLLEKLGVGEFLNYRPAQLSTGQRLRVAVARALANQPPVLLADEPTAALDADSAHVVMDLIQNTCHENGSILLVASHDPHLTQRFELIAHLQTGSITVEEKVLA